VKKYRKNVVISYQYVASHEAEQAVAGVFDDIFMRLIKMHQRNIYTGFSKSTVELFGFVLDAREKGVIPAFRLLTVN